MHFQYFLEILVSSQEIARDRHINTTTTKGHAFLCVPPMKKFGISYLQRKRIEDKDLCKTIQQPG